MAKEPNYIYGRKSNSILIAEIVPTLRAQGNASGTGIIIDASADSPIVSGIYSNIPSISVDIMNVDSFADKSKNFIYVSGDNTRSHPWNSIGAVGLDGVFAPYSTQYDDDRTGPFLPHWTSPSISGTPTSTTLNPFNPFNNLQNVSPSGHTVLNDPWSSGGHNISFALNYNPNDTGYNSIYPSGSGSPASYDFETDHFVRHTVETSGIRGVGLRSPIVLTGWGYDVNGDPVPSGTGIINGISGIHPEATWNPATWKSGPVDLRWDEERGVWTGGNTTKVYLVKITNLYTPPSFSFEVDRSNSRNQYSRNAPASLRAYVQNDPIYDPEYIAYDANPDNKGTYEQLDYSPNDYNFPFYEAFIIRETTEDPTPASNYYNIWTQDCQDCGHITSQCSSGLFPRHGSSGNLIINKKILIENPLRQSLDVGDLAFTVKTGRRKKVNTGNFIGGSGENASGVINIDASGSGTFQVTSAGSGYIYGGFGILGTGCAFCTNLSLTFTDGELTAGTLDPDDLNASSGQCSVSIYPNNAVLETEELDIHWILQAEFKSQQVVTHVECDNGILQSCSLKIQTQGYKTCEWCGEDTAYINS